MCTENDSTPHKMTHEESEGQWASAPSGQEVCILFFKKKEVCILLISTGIIHLQTEYTIPLLQA